MSASTGLDRSLAELAGLGREALAERYAQIYGRPAPPRLATQVIALAVAYRLQETAFGGLAPRVRTRIAASGSDLLGGTAHRAGQPAGPGTTLIREWQGRPHTVLVRADGVEYQGQRYRSLTEVALRITGQKRSGPAFFGLRSARV